MSCVTPGAVMLFARFLARAAICSRMDYETPGAQACRSNFFSPRANPATPQSWDSMRLPIMAFPRLSFVRIVRRHKLRQALSTARALQTGLWKVQKGKTTLREPEFDPDLIEQSLREAERQEKVWDDFFRRIRVKPFNVEYEKLCQNYEPTIRAVLSFLKIKLPASARVGPPATTRQADEISRMWEERFVAERPSAYSPASG